MSEQDGGTVPPAQLPPGRDPSPAPVSHHPIITEALGMQ